VEIGVLTLRVLSITAGAILIFAALFLREYEERTVENILEEWWIRIDDLQRTLVSRHVALVRVAATFAARALDSLFGYEIMSLRAACVSGCLSFLSLYLVSPVVFTLAFRRAASTLQLRVASSGVMYLTLDDMLAILRDPGRPLAARIALASAFTAPAGRATLHILGVLALCGLVLGATTTRFRHAPIAAWSAGALVLTFAFWFSEEPWDVSAPSGYYIDAILLGTLCDIVAIVIARRLLRVQQVSSSLWTIVSAGMLQVLLAVTLIVLPISTGMWVTAHGNPVLFGLGLDLVVSSLTNVFSAAVSISFGVAVATLIVHRMLWPVIDRPLYALARFGLFRNALRRSAVFGVGLAAVTSGLGQTDTMIAAVTQLLKSA